MYLPLFINNMSSTIKLLTSCLLLKAKLITLPFENNLIWILLILNYILFLYSFKNIYIYFYHIIEIEGQFGNATSCDVELIRCEEN